MQVESLGWKDPLEEGVAAHSSILAWRIPWTEEPVRLRSMELQSQTQPKQLSRHACMTQTSSKADIWSLGWGGCLCKTYWSERWFKAWRGGQDSSKPC